MKTKNLLPEFLTDEEFIKLEKWHLLDHGKIRDFRIRQAYQKLRDEKVGVEQCLNIIRLEYPHLQKDTLRKITYNKSNEIKN